MKRARLPARRGRARRARAGTAADPKDAEGISELLADTLKEGTATRTVAPDRRGAADRGRRDRRQRRRRRALRHARPASARARPRSLEVVADVARNAVLPRGRGGAGQGQRARRGSRPRSRRPEFLAQKALAQAVYGDHPYHIVAPTEGDAAGRDARSSSSRSTRGASGPSGALLVVVGDVDAAAVHGGRRPGSSAPGRARARRRRRRPPRPRPRPRGGSSSSTAPGSVQSQILIGPARGDGRPTPTTTRCSWPTRSARAPSAAASTENIREDKGYTYSPGGGIAGARRRAGLLDGARRRAHRGHGGAARSRCSTSWTAWARPLPTDEELSRAKRYQGGLYLLRNQIQSAVAQTLASNWVNGLPPEALGEFVTKVNAVTADQVRAAGRTFFPSARRRSWSWATRRRSRRSSRRSATVDSVQP